MPRSPRLLAGLSIANGGLTLLTAVVFAAGDYGAFRAQDSGAFRAIAGLIVAFAALAFLVFAAAGLRRIPGLVAGLAVIDALANGVLYLSPFRVPGALHLLVVATSVLVFCVAVTETSTVPSRVPAWSVATILLGSVAGGIALIGVGRYEFAPGEVDVLRIAGLAIAIVGLTLLALGTGAIVMGRVGKLRFDQLLLVLTAAAGIATIQAGTADLQREGVGRGSIAAVGNPWSGRFWLLLAATLVAALILGGFRTLREPAGHPVASG